MNNLLTLKAFLRCVTGGLLILGGVWALSGCGHTDTSPGRGESEVLHGDTLVMPFINMAEVFGSNTSVRGPVSSTIFVTGPVAKDAALYLSNELYRLLGQEKRIKWGTQQDVQDATPFETSDLRHSHIAQLQALGRRNGAENVMVGYLYAFRDREGGDYGVDKPSQVALEMALLNTATGRIIWQRTFKETQKSLSEDLLQLKTFIKRKGRWVSAKEMASSALKEILKTAPRFPVQ